MTLSKRIFITAERDLLFHFKSIGRDIAAQHLLVSHCRFLLDVRAHLEQIGFLPVAPSWQKREKLAKPLFPSRLSSFFSGRSVS
jgi:hypothetical protein